MTSAQEINELGNSILKKFAFVPIAPGMSPAETAAMSQPQVDPATGMPMDPAAGMPPDPSMQGMDPSMQGMDPSMQGQAMPAPEPAPAPASDPAQLYEMVVSAVRQVMQENPQGQGQGEKPKKVSTTARLEAVESFCTQLASVLGLPPPGAVSAEQAPAEQGAGFGPGAGAPAQPPVPMGPLDPNMAATVGAPGAEMPGVKMAGVRLASAIRNLRR